MSAQSASEADAANPFPDLPAIRGAVASPQSARLSGPTVRRFPSPRFGDYSRTRFEPRVAFGGPDEAENADEVPVTRRFSPLETTSGLPDDSREADERVAERRLRDLRGRVKAAHAAVSTTPGLAETLARDWRKAARFYVRFGVTEAMFRHGVPTGSVEEGNDHMVSPSAPADWISEVRAREAAVLPDSE